MYLVLILGAFVMVLPFLWMLSTSVMTIGEANGGRLLPRLVRVTCPHVNLAKTSEDTVVDFAVGPEVRQGEQELGTDAYYVEVREGEGWEFRLVNNSAVPVAIVPVGQPDAALSEEWQPVPAGGGVVDTGRGLSFTFAPPDAYQAADRRSGAARTEYVNCCEYPTDAEARRQADRTGRQYSGRPIPEDLSNCRTTGRQASYFFAEFIGGNYYTAWVSANFRDYMWNSVRLTAITLVGMLIVSTMAAYAFARMQFPGRSLLFVLLLSTMMIPETVTMIPNFLTITGNNPFLPFINWYDNWPGLTIPFIAGFFNIFLLRQFFAQIPDELWDAARIDGAGHLRFLIRIVLPLSKAPIMTVIIFAFIGSWNALLWPLIATHLWMAGATLSMLPVLLLYFLAQKQFIEGIATTGLKG
jgi:ABC-type glycerol-3-phosphate transport system permease component